MAPKKFCIHFALAALSLLPMISIAKTGQSSPVLELETAQLSVSPNAGDMELRYNDSVIATGSTTAGEAWRSAIRKATSNNNGGRVLFETGTSKLIGNDDKVSSEYAVFVLKRELMSCLDKLTSCTGKGRQKDSSHQRLLREGVNLEAGSH